MTLVADDEVWPGWLREIDATLSVSSQFVLSGNVHDRYLIPGDNPIADSIADALRVTLESSGISVLVVFDPVDGYGVRYSYHQDEAAAWSLVQQVVGQDLRGARPDDLGVLRAVLRANASGLDGTGPTQPLGVVVDYASRLIDDPTHLRGSERELFTLGLKLSHDAVPRTGATQTRDMLFNPIFWVAEREHDLPAWFTGGTSHVRAIQIPDPDLGERTRTAEILAEAGLVTLDHDATTRLAARSAGLGLNEVVDSVTLARDQDITGDDIEDAVQAVTTGVSTSPWRRGDVADRMRSIDIDRPDGTTEAVDAATFLSSRIIGQPAAITKAADILKRAVLGLSGAQSGRNSARPRGVLFLAGPTGTGKTELAKTVTELVFGTPDAYVRFDMSEFSAEQSGDRLIGAPPGYVGFDAGGELTNAVRQKPHSLLLFDEIEKANRLILDKFLQILDEGRLTDGRGTTVHFSETLIVFTSNLGMTRPDPEHPEARIANIKPGMPYPEIEQLVNAEIHRFFTEHLNRPEILNRVGDNVVVFDFISPDAARQIAEGQLRNVLDRVTDSTEINVELSPGALGEITALATADPSFGGRGIGNVIESDFVNPLARALFDAGTKAGDSVSIAHVRVDGGTPVVELG